MLQKMQNELVNSFKEVRGNAELTAQQVYDITRKAALESVQNIKGGVKDLRAVAKAVVHSSVDALIEAEEASKEKISAALQGAFDGIKEIELQVMNSAQKELNQAKIKLLDEEAKLSNNINDALDGAKEAAHYFNDEVKADIEMALSDTKLKSTELLGLTKETVKEAVRKAIETEANIEQTIETITRDATNKAMQEASFTTERVSRISEAVLLAAVEAAEELGCSVSETANAAVEGVRHGLSDSIEFAHKSIDDIEHGAKEFAINDLKQTKDDLEVVGEVFVETLRKVADKSGAVASETLHELADDAKKTGSSLQEKALITSRTIAGQLQLLGSNALDKTEQVGSHAAHALTEEAKELSERMLAVAKGATKGMWEGAKAAYKKDQNKETK